MSDVDGDDEEGDDDDAGGCVSPLGGLWSTLLITRCVDEDKLQMK